MELEYLLQYLVMMVAISKFTLYYPISSSEERLYYFCEESFYIRSIDAVIIPFLRECERQMSSLACKACHFEFCNEGCFFLLERI
jgi:hypothetical protein